MEQLCQLNPAEKSLLIAIISSLIANSFSKEETIIIGDFLEAIGSVLVSIVD